MIFSRRCRHFLNHIEEEIEKIKNDSQLTDIAKNLHIVYLNCLKKKIMAEIKRWNAA